MHTHYMLQTAASFQKLLMFVSSYVRTADANWSGAVETLRLILMAM